MWTQQDRRFGSPQCCRSGFTIVELLVVIAIVGVLVGLLSTALGSARESARRVQCSNNLRQLGLGLQSFHATYRHFPFGNAGPDGNFVCWITEILPQIEQAGISERINKKLPVDDPFNLAVSRSVIPTLRCPSSIVDFEGDTDYSGIFGSTLASAGSVGAFGINNGVLVQANAKRLRPVSIGEITDGSSYTICVSEVVDRLEDEFGLWMDGRSCISHDNGGINIDNADEIFSFHPGGAQVVLCDGAVRFINESVQPSIIGALCSRNGREEVNNLWD